MARIKLSGAQVWLGQDKGFQQVEVLIDGDTIAEVAPAIHASAERVVDCAGKHLVPGVIDAQVHFREPGNTYKEDLHTGSMAAAAGGVTTFFEMPNTNPPTTTVEAMEAKFALAREKCITNWAFFAGTTNDNVDQLNRMQHVCGIKIFMGSSTGNLLVDDQDALERIFRDTDPQRVIALHCEDEKRVLARTAEFKHRTDAAVHSLVRDNEACVLSFKRAVDLGNRHQHRTHILHVTTKEEAALLAERSQWITAECAPHHMYHNIDDYAEFGGLMKMNPALKHKEDNDALWAALRNGAIDFIATDHAPHTWEEKTRDNIWQVPAGIPAVENYLGLLLQSVQQGEMTWHELVAWCCEKPASVYKLAKKGAIAPGMDADLCLIDMQHQHTIRNEAQFTKSKWSPWHGRSFTGWPVMTIVLGQVAFQAGTPNLASRGRNAF